VRTIEGRRFSGRIVEVEAYIGEDDLASHACVGLTQRNAVMFGPPGFAYVYLIYGMHHCLNVVTEAEGFPAAVLIRALEPLEGVEEMRERRPRARRLEDLTNGPGKLCQALAIDRSLNGHDLTRGELLWIEADQLVSEGEVARSPRVGVRGDDQAISAPWRFYVVGNPYVSR